MPNKPFECWVVSGAGELHFEMTEEEVRNHIRRVLKHLPSETRDDLAAGLYRAFWDVLGDDGARPLRFTDKDGRHWMIRASTIMAFGVRDPEEGGKSIGFRSMDDQTMGGT